MEGFIRSVTRGRPKRKRSPRAGRAVSARPHTRSPRGANKGKPRVKVDGYRRGRPPKKRTRR